MNIQVIETHTDDGVEWGISFTDCNPMPCDYFKMADEATAYRLQRRLMYCDEVPELIEGTKNQLEMLSIRKEK